MPKIEHSFGDILDRLKEIDGYIRQRQYSGEDIARIMGLDRRRITGYIKLLRDVLKFPVEFDRSKKFFYYSSDFHDFPLMILTEQEVFAYLLARKSLGKYEGSTIHDPLDALFRKLLRHAGLHGPNLLKKMEQKVHFLSTGRMTVSHELMYKLLHACGDCNPVSFDYPSGSRRKGIYPLSLVEHNSRWYLFAQKPNGDLRFYALIRMANVECNKEENFQDTGIDIKEYMKHSFGVFRGEHLYDVRIHFDPIKTQCVKERTWNETQQIHHLEDGSIELTITVNDLTEIKGWILNCGSHAQVLEPPELVNSIKEEVARMQEIYQA